MTIKEIRQSTGLSQQKFAEKYHIPVRNIVNWESPEGNANHRDYPEYVAYLLEKVVEMDLKKAE